MTIIKNETTVQRPHSPVQIPVPAQLGGTIEAGAITTQPVAANPLQTPVPMTAQGYLGTCLVKTYCYPELAHRPFLQNSLRLLPPIFSGCASLVTTDLSLGVTGVFGTGSAAAAGIIGTSFAVCTAMAVVTPPAIALGQCLAGRRCASITSRENH